MGAHRGVAAPVSIREVFFSFFFFFFFSCRFYLRPFFSHPIPLSETLLLYFMCSVSSGLCFPAQTSVTDSVCWHVTPRIAPMKFGIFCYTYIARQVSRRPSQNPITYRELVHTSSTSSYNHVSTRGAVVFVPAPFVYYSFIQLSRCRTK